MQKQDDVTEKRSLTLAGGVWEGLKLMSTIIRPSHEQHGHSTPQSRVVREVGSGSWLHEISQEHARITYNLQV